MSACANPRHDHDLAQHDAEGNEVIGHGCAHCGEPAHFDADLDLYLHDALDAAPCFLIPERPAEASACTTEVAR